MILFQLFLTLSLYSWAQHRFSSVEQLWAFAEVNSPAAVMGKLQKESAAKERQLLVSGFYPRVNGYSTADYNLIIPSMVVPDVIFGGEPGKFTAAQFGMPLSVNAGAELSMPVIDFAKWSQLRSANMRMQAANTGSKALMEDLRIQLAQLYYQWIFTKQLQLVNDENRQTVDRLVQLMQKRFNEGVINPADLNRAKKLKADHDILAISYNQNIQVLSLAMKRLLNLPAEASIELNGQLGSFEVSRALQLADTANSTRSAIVQQQQLTELALNEVKSGAMTALPKLNFSSRYYHQWQMDPSKHQTVGFDAAIVGLRLDVPITAGRYHRMNRERMEIEYKTARERQRELTAAVNQQEAEWATRLRAALEKQKITGYRLRLAADNLRIANLNMKEGIMEFDEYNNIFLEYNQSKLDNLQTLADAELYELLATKKWYLQ